MKEFENINRERACDSSQVDIPALKGRCLGATTRKVELRSKGKARVVIYATAAIAASFIIFTSTLLIQDTTPVEDTFESYIESVDEQTIMYLAENNYDDIVFSEL